MDEKDGRKRRRREERRREERMWETLKPSSTFFINAHIRVFNQHTYIYIHTYIHRER